MSLAVLTGCPALDNGLGSFGAEPTVSIRSGDNQPSKKVEDRATVPITFGVRWPKHGNQAIQAMPEETKAVVFHLSKNDVPVQSVTVIRDPSSTTASKTVALYPGDYTVRVRAYLTDSPSDTDPVVATGAKDFSVIEGQEQSVSITLALVSTPTPGSPEPITEPSSSPTPTPSPTATPLPASVSWGEISPGINFNDSYFVSFTEGWVVGNSGAIRKTEDAGEIWKSVNTGYAGDFTSVFFAPDSNGKVGWIGGGDTLLKTADGGLTWTRQSLGVVPVAGRGPYLNGIFFRDANRGYVALSAASGYSELAGLFATSDGGNSWTRIQEGNVTWLRGMPDGTVYFGSGIRNKYQTWDTTRRLKSGAVSSVYSSAFWFINSNVASSNTLLACELGKLLESLDGGLSWSAINYSPNSSSVWWGVGSISAQEALGIREDVSGYAYLPRIVETTDGGRTWKTLVTMSNTNYSLRRDNKDGTTPRMFVFDRRHAWHAFTDNSKLLRIGETE